LGQAVARLAFTSDPEDNITDNESIAIKRLNNVCRKYQGDPSVCSMITKGFQKLIDRGHIIPYNDVTGDI